MVNTVEAWPIIKGIIENTFVENRVLLPAPPERRPRRRERDPEDMMVRVRPERTADSGWSIYISYEDCEGFASERRITLIRNELRIGGAEAIYAFCHEVGEPRLFRLDRITAMANISTGELLDPLSHIAELRQNGLPFVNRGMITIAKMLVFIARCDGRHHPLEWEVLEDCLARYALRFGGDDADVFDAYSQMRCLAPDGQDFGLCFHALLRSPAPARKATIRFARQCCAAIVDADGILTPEEVAWGTAMFQILDIMEPRE